MNKTVIKDLALANGFKLKRQPCGEMDLNPYVYKFSSALIASLAVEHRAMYAELENLKETNRSLLAEKAELIAVIKDCEEFLKEDESPAECIERNRFDAIYALKQTVKYSKERDQLAVQNERLRIALKSQHQPHMEYVPDLDCTVTEVLSESSEVSLAEIQAQVVEKALTDLGKEYARMWPTKATYTCDSIAEHINSMAVHYANQIRQQAKEDESE